MRRFIPLLLAVAGCVGNVGDPAAPGDPVAGGGPGMVPTRMEMPGTMVAGGGGAPGGAPPGPAPAADGTVDFFRDIQPILGDYCVRCHGGVRELGTPPLNLQGRDRALVGRPAVFPLMLARVQSTDPDLRMPLGAQPLPADKVDKLRRWVAQGAPWPTHWAFAPLGNVQPAQLAVRDQAWVRTPIDRFVLSRLEQVGLRPSPEAEPTTLLRRVSLDLTGLPPTPKEVDDFLADRAPDAYDKVVDRLLASPAFGERWGRHWLDQARYADSDGYGVDAPRPAAWRWRDWVIDAINRDVPFDQFTVEQIAGDLLPGATPTQVLANAFHVQTLYNREGGVDPEEDRTKRIIDRVSTVAEVWLGLTAGCTQCHSHPYDALAQKEFYRLYAFFNNADEAKVTVPSTADPASATMAADVVRERTQGVRKTYLFVRGDFLNPDRTQELVGGTPAVLHPFKPRAAVPDRLDLARWIVDPANPLTPRVTVNTTWFHLLGQGLVASLDDFGSRASLPSHPELLDWLARDFVASGWRRKRAIKQIVTSATYRQASVGRADAATMDPDNLLLHRQNRLRVEAEIVGDLALAVSGLLAPKLGGASVYPPIPEEVLGLSRGGTAWPTSQGPDRYRRGLYTFHKRTSAYPNLQVFDWPEADVTVTGRRRSNTPLQALTTMHNTVFAEAAQAFARRIQTEKPGPVRDQIVWAFRLALARPPTDAELGLFQGLYDDARRLYEASPADAMKAVGTYLPAGAAPGAAAAWVATARVVLNLDELITRE
jgi:hypothetical protein